MIVGAGELLVDAVFIADGDYRRLEEVRGGGSVWNALANAAAQGCRCRAVATAGDDWRGDIATADLESLGVSVAVATEDNRITPTIFQLPDEHQTLLDRDGWQMSPECPVCMRRVLPSRQPNFSRGPMDKVHFDPSTVLCVDRVTKERLALVAKARSAGSGTVLDLGHRSFVRYMPVDSLVSALGLFDLVQAPADVASMVARRLGTELGGLTAATGGSWVVTDGTNGIHVMSGRDSIHVVAPVAPMIVDTTGAGDALLGTVLARLHHSHLHPRAASVEAIAEAAEVAAPVVAAALSRIGARGHLKDNQRSVPLRGATLEQLRSLDPSDGGCQFCGSRPVRPRRPGKVGASVNLGRLQQRVAAAVGATQAVRLAADWLEDTAPTVVCGTGGSLPVAELVVNLMNAGGGTAFVRHPAEYLAIPPSVDRVLAISYSGTNTDISRVIRHAVEHGIRRVGIVTINPSPPIGEAGTLDRRVEVISYGSTTAGRERGFVSIAATVSPAAVWAAAAHDAESVLAAITSPAFARRRFDETAAFLMDAAKRGAVVELLATGWARPAALDLESKMTESDTVIVRVHDTKDFSHGRFLSVLERPRPRLLVTVGPRTAYQERLAKVLSSDAAGFVAVAIERQGGLGAFDALVAMQHIATLTAGFSGRDLSRPETIPKAGLELYKWDGDLP